MLCECSMSLADLTCSQRPSSKPPPRGAPSGAFSSAASSKLRSSRLGARVGCMSRPRSMCWTHARARAAHLPRRPHPRPRLPEDLAPRAPPNDINQRRVTCVHPDGARARRKPRTTISAIAKNFPLALERGVGTSRGERAKPRANRNPKRACGTVLGPHSSTHSVLRIS